MTALWITLAIAALLIILFSVHIKAKICFSIGGDNIIELRYGFLKFRVLPKTAEKAIEKETEEDAGEKPEKPKQKRNRSNDLKLLKATYKDIKNGAFGILGYILKHAVTIRDLSISADCGFGDPLVTGMAAGAANAAVYNIIGFLQRRVKLKNWSVSLNPDFNERKLKAGVYTVLCTNALHILALGGIFTKTAVKILYKAWRLRKNEQSGK